MQRARETVQLVLGLAFVAAGLFYVWQRRAPLAETLNASWAGLLLMLLVISATWIVIAAQTYVLFRAEGVPISFWENFVLSSAAGFGNYLPLRVGMILRAQYMKRKYGMGYVRFGSLSAIRMAIQISISGLVGIGALLFGGLTSGRMSYPLLAIFGSLTIVACVALTRPLPPLAFSGRRAARFWHDLREGFGIARRRPRLAAMSALWGLAQYVLLSIRFGIAFHLLGTSAPPWVLLVLGVASSVSSLLAITPGGLGIRELIIGYVVFATGQTFDVGIFAGAFDRAAQLIVVATLGAGCFTLVWFRGRAGVSHAASGSRTSPADTARARRSD
ncbi:MAG: hypothetical protein GEV06_08560 [Luteitalea sp.]|nr:hypothetical protein [Luteitalea sp.]